MLKFTDLFLSFYNKHFWKVGPQRPLTYILNQPNSEFRIVPQLLTYF